LTCWIDGAEVRGRRQGCGTWVPRDSAGCLKMNYASMKLKEGCSKSLPLVLR